MATVAEVQLMKPTAMTVDDDVYSGITNVRSSKNGLPTYPVRGEGDTEPIALEPIESNSPPVSGSIQTKSAAVLALAGTQASTMTVTGKDVYADGATKTATYTGVNFERFSGGMNKTNVEGNSLNFTALTQTLT